MQIKPGNTVVVKRNASNAQLQQAIEAAVPAAVKQARSIASRYKGKSESESCKKIFDYLKNNVTYRADGENQQVRLPSGLMRTLQGDCKSYALFTSAILTNLGIPHSLVYTSYDPKDPTPSHIYVVTDKGCTIDAVYGKFNAEKKPTFKKLKKMNIAYIAGTRSRGRMGRSCGMGAIDTGKTWAEKLGIWDSIPFGVKANFYKNLAFPPYVGGREVVKALLRKNAGGFANSLARIYNIARANNASPEFKKYRDMELLWLQKGGNPDELRVAFQEGNSKTPTGAKFNEVLKKAKAGQSISIGEAIAGAISALFGKKYDPSTGKILGIGAAGGDDAAEAAATAAVWLPIVRELVQILKEAFQPVNTQPLPSDQPPTGSGSGTSTSSVVLPILLIGGAAAAYFYFNKKK